MNANMKRLLIFALVPVTVWGIGSTFTKQKIDRIGVNTESQITMEDTTRFSSGTALTVPYLDASKDLVSSSVTPTELGFLSGVSSSIQTQINSKQDPVSGTANEIDFASDIIGLADNPILPGNEGVTLPSGTTAQRDSTPPTGQLRWNSDNTEAEIYDGTQWGSVGGGAGGSRLNLLDDPSFEKGVANGSCTGCTASQDTTDYLATPNNEASLKMAFSAASGNYTWTESTSAQYSNVAGTVSAWIKTSASDCHFDELVDGTQSQTVAIGSSDEWKQYIINGTTGTTSYGWRVRCDTAITDDVFVDETFAGAAEPDTFEIGTASLWGSVKWDTTTNCAWQNSTTGAWNNFSTDADCDDNARTIKGQYNSTNGDAANSDGQTPQIKFSYIPAGVLRCEAKGWFYNTGANNVNWRFSDGTNSTSSNSTYGPSTASAIPVIVGEFNYTTPQTSETTIQIQSYPNANTADILVSSTARELEISCYHYPAPQKVVAAKCDGLECINEFSAEVDASGAVSSENVNWIDGNCAVTATNQYSCDFVSGVFANRPNCSVTVHSNTSSTSDANITSTTDSTQLDYQTYASSTAAALAQPTYIKCQRAGSDYKQFDTRFIPVTDNEAQYFEHTASITSFGSSIVTNGRWESPELEKGDSCFTTSQSATNGTQFTMTNNCIISISIDGNFNSTNQGLKIFRDGAEVKVSFNNSATNVHESISTTMLGLTGEVFSAGRSGSNPMTAKNLHVVARPAYQKAFIGNLTPKEFVQTPGSTKPVLVSALVTDGSGTTTVTEEDDDFINGVCTNSSTGEYVCTFTTGYWSATPHCWNSNTDNSRSNRLLFVSTTSVRFDTYDSPTGTKIDSSFYIFCKGTKN